MKKINNDNRNHMMQSALRCGLSLCLLSGGSVLPMFAQNVEESASSADRIAKTTSRSSKYVMKEVKGQVLDAATNLALPGVRVQALNNRYYTALTDEQGYYKIKVPEHVTALYISTDGYNALQVPVKGSEAPTAKLYDIRLKSLYSDATSVLNKSDYSPIDPSSSTLEYDVETALNGVVHTINRGGMTAQGAAMFINGINSLNANAQPLIIVDGVIWDMQYDRTAIHTGFHNNVFNLIDTEDIENIEVLRNGTALYGSEGANGVIRITTKRGKSMATRIKIRAFGGVELVPNTMSVMNDGQYRNYLTEFLGTTKNADLLAASHNIPFLNEDKGYLFYNQYHNNTDWQKELYANAFTQNYRVSVQGGDDVAKYNLSLGYIQWEATAKKNDFNRLNIRFNTDVHLAKGFTTELDMAYVRNAYNLRDNGWAENYTTRNIASPNVLGLVQSPFVDPYTYFVSYAGNNRLTLGHTDRVLAAMNYTDANNPFLFASNFGFEGLAHPYWILQNGEGDNKNYQEQTLFSVNIAPRYEFNRYFTLTNRFSYLLNRSNEKYFMPKSGTPLKFVNNLGTVQSVIGSQFGKETTLFNDLRLTWSRNYGKHQWDVFGGFRMSSYTYSDSHSEGYNNDNDKMPNLRYSLQYIGYGGVNDRWINLSYYANVDYNYKNRYFLKAITSAETSSRFGKEAESGVKITGVKWGLFPSLQAAWVMSNESWFNLPGIDYAKLSAGYEVSGNDNLDYYAARTYFRNVKFLDRATALELANIQNSKIQWETTSRWNLGIQLNLLENRLSLGAEYFSARTTDLLTRKTVSDITGLNRMWANEGELTNKGVNISVNAVVVNNKDWKWQLGATLGHYKNEITALPKTANNIVKSWALDANGNKMKDREQSFVGYTSSVYGKDNILTSLGESVGVFYGYQTKGVFSTTEEAKAAGLKYPTGLSTQPSRDFKAGDMHFVDQNGDGWINEADRVVIGNPNPDIYGNIYTTLSWKNIKLDLGFKYSVGNEVFNYQRMQLESANNIWNQTTAVVNRWRTEGHVTDVPRTMSPESLQWVNNERFSDRWIEDGSYLKLKNVRLSYEVPVSLSWLQGLTVWGEANNVFTLSKYWGADPEVTAGNGILYQGIDAGRLMQSRNFNLGVTLNL